MNKMKGTGGFIRPVAFGHLLLYRVHYPPELDGVCTGKCRERVVWGLLHCGGLVSGQIFADSCRWEENDDVRFVYAMDVFTHG